MFIIFAMRSWSQLSLSAQSVQFVPNGCLLPYQSPNLFVSTSADHTRTNILAVLQTQWRTHHPSTMHHPGPFANHFPLCSSLGSSTLPTCQLLHTHACSSSLAQDHSHRNFSRSHHRSRRNDCCKGHSRINRISSLHLRHNTHNSPESWWQEKAWATLEEKFCFLCNKDFSKYFSFLVNKGFSLMRKESPLSSKRQIKYFAFVSIRKFYFPFNKTLLLMILLLFLLLLLLLLQLRLKLWLLLRLLVLVISY